MNTEEFQIRRTLAIAQMAATLEAGDRASGTDGERSDAKYYAKRATRLFEAVDDMSAGLVEVVHS